MADDEEEKSVSWLAVPHKGDMLDKTGGTIGTAESLLGDENADIFHGIVMKAEHSGDFVEVPAQRIPRITTKAIYTDLDASEVSSLEPYSEQKWEHVEWGGLFRRRPTWTEEGKPPPRIGG
ncbi:MAG: hypothetical protein ACRDJU_10405 [Actinomycetota bacterium]